MPNHRLLPIAAVIAVSILMPLALYHPGIRFSDDTQYLTGVWRLVEYGDCRIPKHEMLEEGCVGSFFVPGTADCFYSLNPIGMCFVLYPFLYFGGFHGIFLANIILGGLAIGLTYAWLSKLFDPPVALSGALLFGSSPTFQLFMSTSMSHIAALAVQSTGLYLLTCRSGIVSFSAAAIGGFILGIGVMIRFDFIVMIIPILATLLIPLDTSRPPDYSIRFRRAMVAVMAFASGVSIQIGYQHLFLGSILKSGYQQHQKINHLLRWDMLWDAFPRACREIFTHGLGYVAVIGVAGAIYLMVVNRRTALILLSVASPVFFLYLLFHPFSIRYFIPVFPILSVSAAFVIHRIPAIRFRNALIAAVLLVLLVLNGLTAHRMLQGRNRSVVRQMEIIELFREHVPKEATVFVTTPVGLMMKFSNDPFDIRDSIVLLGPHDDEFDTESTAAASSHRNPRVIQSAQSKTMRSKKPAILNRILRERGEAYAALRDDQYDRLPREYPIRLEALGRTTARGGNYTLVQIFPIQPWNPSNHSDEITLSPNPDF